MEQTTFPVYKSKQMKPLFYSCLTTSTPESHQVAKRIKGLQGYAEHYKGNRVDYPYVSSSFPPLRTRDYCKARELTLEIWDPMTQISFLERFLKSQKNLQDIRIKILGYREYKRETLKWLCEILSKIEKLNRVHIDFGKDHLERIEQMKSELTKDIRCLRKLPNLKNVDVTIDGQQVFLFSVNLKRMGLDIKHLPEARVIQKLIHRALKFHQVDTIRTEFIPQDSFAQSLAFIISKLPNFRELNLHSSQNSIFSFSLECAMRILDSLMKASKFENLRLDWRVPEASVISLLKHPIFKTKSLKKTSLSFSLAESFATSDYLNEVLDLLGEIPNLYELSLRFYFSKMGNGIAESHMEKISRMTSLRKLKIVFDFTSISLSEKRAGDIFSSIFNNMQFLEELELHLPRQYLGLNTRDIQGLPRLKKAVLHFKKSFEEKRGNDMPNSIFSNLLPKAANDTETKGEASDMITIMEILGKCHQLRELELKILDSVPDYEEMVIRVSESLSKLKRLQVFKIRAVSGNGISDMAMESLENLFEICHKLRDLQDLNVQMWDLSLPLGNMRRVRHFYEQVRRNKKYRFILNSLIF